MTNLLVEGGGRVLGAFLDAGQVDAVDVYIAPILAGGAGDFTPARGLGCRRMADALRLDRHDVSVIDGDVRLQGTIARPRAAVPSALDSTQAFTVPLLQTIDDGILRGVFAPCRGRRVPAPGQEPLSGAMRARARPTT